MGHTLSNIDPQLIMIRQEGGCCFLDILNYIPDQSSSYIRALRDSSKKPVLSPLQLRSLERREAKPADNPEKSDVFALGVVVLSTIFCTNYLSFYDYEEYKINWTKILEKLMLMKKLDYSRILIGCISNMLNEKETDRPTLEELLNFISAHRNDMR